MPDAAYMDSLRCSFCFRSLEEVGRLLSKPGTPPSRAYICDDCVRLCYAILQEEDPDSAEQPKAGRSVSDC